MSTQTLTITLNEEEYALLVAQNRHDNYCQIQMNNALTVEVPLEITAVVCLITWLRRHREHKLVRIQAELSALHAERQGLLNLMVDMGHPGTYRDLYADLEEIESHIQEVQAELAAFDWRI